MAVDEPQRPCECDICYQAFVTAPFHTILFQGVAAHVTAHVCHIQISLEHEKRALMNEKDEMRKELMHLQAENGEIPKHDWAGVGSDTYHEKVPKPC